MSIRWTALAITGTLILVVGLQNMEPVDFRVLFWQIGQVPKLLFISGTFLLGFIVGALFFAWPRKPKYER